MMLLLNSRDGDVARNLLDMELISMAVTTYLNTQKLIYINIILDSDGVMTL